MGRVGEFAADRLEQKLLSIARMLGTPIPVRKRACLVQRLKPQVAGSSKPNSLSSRYALRAFPPHTDTAHWLTPCRYVLLCCAAVGDESRTTSLLDSTSLDATISTGNRLESTPYRIENGRESFVSTIRSTGSQVFRFDPNCMRPFTEEGQDLLRLVGDPSRYQQKEEIIWQRYTVLAIDNWRVLHARAAGEGLADQRCLLRVLVSAPHP